MTRQEKVFSFSNLTEPYAITITAGPERHFIAEALDIDGSIIYRGESTLDTYPGEPVTVHIVMQKAPYWAPSVYVNDNAAIGGNGSYNAPFNTIADAVTYITSNTLNTEPINIKVAAGTYNEKVFLASNIRLMGGYSEDFSTRRFISPQDREKPAYKTLVKYTITMISEGVVSITSGSQNCTVEGLYIEISPTTTQTSGIELPITSENTRIFYNTVKQTNAQDYTRGIHMFSSVSYYIIGNYVDIDTSQTYNVAIYDDQSSKASGDLTIANNVLIGTAGIQLNDTNNLVRYIIGNTIDADTGINMANVSSAVVINNLIKASSATIIGAGSPTEVYNNYAFCPVTDNFGYDSTKNNISQLSSTTSQDPAYDIYKKATSDTRIYTNGATKPDTLSGTMNIPEDIRELLYKDILGVSRGPVWAIGAYQQQ
ncbi:hypothetical protein WKV44_09340 [Spirochaetia bacterium 38H-sp]|uniref:DUF1565 domain-containing protein n=1 Tax=Rarispira pelagica TaxID=3141764 RepID=A0ABU9UFI0_9SPIR